MLAYAQGDVQAFEQLYSRHKGALYRYCLRGIDNEARAAELFQDIWTKVIDTRQRYQPSAKFTTWLYRIAHNRLVDEYRRIRPDTRSDTEVTHPQPSVESHAMQQERFAHFMKLLMALPFEQREVILLREERGLTLEEIAEVVGVGRETIKSRLRYALAKLRQDDAALFTDPQSKPGASS